MDNETKVLRQINGTFLIRVKKITRESMENIQNVLSIYGDLSMKDIRTNRKHIASVSFEYKTETYQKNNKQIHEFVSYFCSGMISRAVFMAKMDSASYNYKQSTDNLLGE